MMPDDPYAAPSAAVSDPVGPLEPIRWKRILAWGALICVTVASIYVLSGIVGSDVRFYGITIEDITAAILSFVLYLIFLQTASRRHFLQLMCVFLAAQIFGIALNGAIGLFLMVLVDDPFDDVVSFAELGENLLVCLLAYATWHVTMQKQSRAQ